MRLYTVEPETPHDGYQGVTFVCHSNRERWAVIGLEAGRQIRTCLNHPSVLSLLQLMGLKSGQEEKKQWLCDRLWFESHKPKVQFKCILRASFADGVQQVHS